MSTQQVVGMRECRVGNAVGQAPELFDMLHGQDDNISIVPYELERRGFELSPLRTTRRPSVWVACLVITLVDYSRGVLEESDVPHKARFKYRSQSHEWCFEALKAYRKE